MNVLFVAPLPEPTTGQSLASRVLLDDLAKCHSVAVVNLSQHGLRPGIRSWSRIGQVLRIAWRVFRGMRSADVVYVTISESIAGNCKDLLLYALCGRMLQRVVVHLHGGAGMRLLMAKGTLTRWINTLFLGRIGGVIVLGKRHVPIFEGVVAADRLHIVPNFAEDDLFVTTQDIDKKFSAPSPLRILFLSNLLVGKGHRELLEAFLRLGSEARRLIRLDFAGSFDTAEARIDFVDRIGRVPEVTYHGPVSGERKRLLLREAHVFCLPTYYPYEGQPISILEAYASGCAVITTDHSGIFDVFTPEVNGYAVEKKSIDSLVMALERAVAAPAGLRAFATANHAIALKQYRSNAYTRSLLQVLETTWAASRATDGSRGERRRV
ncbi:MAG: glycosyltransferase family 4 protein [Deltaproteobacteria bacterium]|nr:glycosyltransferase family 4 protein [Deltaproteobacteria bacterium]